MTQNLPEPSFIERDLEKVIERIRTRFESKTGKTLSPMHPFMLFIESIAYEVYLLRIAFQDAALQNLLDFARFPILDWLGEYKKTKRLADESNDKYRERIRKAPEKFSTCGPVGAYRQHVLAVSKEIIDVSVYSEPQSGVAELYVLTKSLWTASLLAHEISLPEADKTKIDGVNLEVIIQELLTQVETVCSNKKMRPMTEKVEAYLPETVPFIIKAYITLYKDAPPNMEKLMENVRKKALEFAQKQVSSFAPGVIRSQIIDKLHLPGVYKVELISPVMDISLSYSQVAQCTGIDVIQVGVVDGEYS